ncbi:helix-turn-helix domain-containing protein [Streptococcus dentasini]
MGIKGRLGQRIREVRQERKLSRDNVCGNGEKLTVRQLVRIESGESLPSIEKLEYIARVLNTTMSDLLEGDDIKIPSDYFEKKQRIIKFPTYGDPDRVQQKQKMIEEIYEQYFELLPEDELLFLDLSENIYNSLLGDRLPNIEEIYDDAFEQVLKKKVFQFNDYLYLGYYLLKIQREKYYDAEVLQKIKRKLLRQEPTSDELYNVELLVTLMDIISVYAHHDDYRDVLSLAEKAEEVIERAQLHTYKAGVLEAKAKYYIKVKGNKEKAREFYNQALAFGQVLGDSVIIEDIKMEMRNDGLSK